MSFSPNLGRWLQQDPIGSAGETTNLYQMEGNNPVNERDPLGLEVYKGWGIWKLYPHLEPYPGSGEGDNLQTPNGIFTVPELIPYPQGHPEPIPYPQGHPRAGKLPSQEGPYAGTTETFGAFYFSVQYKTPCCECQPPGAKKKGEPLNAQDYGNSGIYIFDRWEVQIVDPFRGGKGKGEGQDITGEGKNDPKFSTPGNPYGVENPKGYKNWAKNCDEWNKLEIWFWPPTGADPQPYLITRLNDQVIFKGKLPPNGTGSRATLPSLREGPIFIQNHWGCPVAFTDPVIKTQKDMQPWPDP